MTKTLSAYETGRLDELRAERWKIIERMSKHRGEYEAKWYRLRKRLEKNTYELYRLTGNPIYNVEG